MATRKVKSSGRFGTGYGKVKEKLVAVETIQRKKQSCPFCQGHAQRKFKGIWHCKKCGKKFTGGTYYLVK